MSQVASESLLWIKNELDSTLVEARHVLESTVEQDDLNLMHTCADHLHQVQGTLRMVEVYGAALLAEEMELVAKALAEGAVGKRRDEAFEVLMRAMVQLPDYLDRVLGGHRDLPIVLMPLINDLRTVRGESLLTEHALFARDMEAHTDALPEMSEKRSGEDIVEVAKRCRPIYQGGLVKWFKGDSGEIDKLIGVAESMEQAASAPRAFHFWWVAGGVLEALKEGGLEASVTLKQLLGQVDRQIKRILDDGEEAFTDAPPVELLNNLLFFLAQATSSGERVIRVREAFGLEGLMPGEAEVEEQRASLSGPNVNLMRTVSSAIKEDLSRVKDSLDIYVRTGKGSAEDLADLEEILKKVADTLGVLGLGDLRNHVEEEHQRLASMVRGDIAADESVLMEMAASLLKVESSLDAEVSSLVVAGREEQDRSEREDASDFRLVSSAVLRECIVNLARVKESIVEYVTNPGESAVLDPLPSLIHQIQAGLDLLELQRPIDLLGSVSRYIKRRIQTANKVPAQAELDRMADAIVSVEYYMETVQQGRGDPQYMLDNAETCVAALGFPIGEESDDEADAEAAAPPRKSEPVEPDRDLDAISADGEPTVVSADQGFPEGETPELAEDDEGDALAAAATAGRERVSGAEDDDEETLIADGSVPELGQGPAQHPAPAAPAADAGPPPVIEGEPDPELLEIFIEEAKEVLEAMQEYLPRWVDNAGDHDALVTVRRSFHTLKGSGRMVGAKFIGEFAWAFENMLNRVIDRTLDRTPYLVELLEEGLAAVPELVEQLEAGTAPSVDAEALRQKALSTTRVATGEAPAAGAATGAAPEAEVDGELELDPILLDIFTKETKGHLEAMRAYLAECDETGSAPYPVTDAAYRAIHTLSGSAHMAGIEPVYKLASPMDKFARRQRDTEEGFGEDGLSLVREYVDAVSGMLVAINDGRELPDTEGLLARLNSHIANLPPVKAVQPEGDDDLPGDSIVEREKAGDDGSEELELSGRIDIEEELEIPPVESEDTSEDEEAIELSGGIEVEEGEADELDAPDTSGELVEEIDQGEEIEVSGGIEVEESPEAPTDIPGGGIEVSEVEEVDPELVEIFTEEANEILLAADDTLQKAIAPGEEQADAIQELQRQVHTLKGGARMAMLGGMGDLSHELETLMIEVAEQRMSMDDDIARLLQRSLDRLHRMLDDVQAGHPETAATDLAAELHAKLTGQPAPSEDGSPAEEPAVAQDRPAPKIDTGADDRPLETRREVTRVQTELLEQLLNQAGEISIFRSRLEQQVSSMEFNLTELSQTVNRLREQLRNLELETEAQILATWQDELASRDDDFDPLEMDQYSTIQQLSRALAESVNDLVSIQGTLNELATESESLLLQQARVTTDLQDGLMRTRMVPFRVYGQRLKRIVRQIAEESGKKADLQIVGGEGELDRQVLERIMPPLEHMLRNAVIHGLESAADRKTSGKPAEGIITIRLHREGSEMVIEVFDDGGGLNVRRIREKAIERKLITDDTELSDSDMAQFIFEPGFSTAEVVTQAAGRGVGMDVVHNEVKQLGGSLAVESKPGEGARFTIRLPFTLAITQALMVTVADELYAIPLPTIEGIARVPRKQVERYAAGEQETVTYGGETYTIQHLGAMLGSSITVPEEEDTVPVIMVRAGEHNTALVTDTMRGSREIVVKSVGPQIANIRGISGATILGDGRILLILDVGALARAGTIVKAVVQAAQAEAEAPVDARTFVLVVDDSITVRRVTQRLLERHDMKVMTAKDGVDALSVLQDNLPDVMLLDIEMPRMDGYELASHIRNDSRLKDVPIIMITSRVGEKHRNRAMELGVNEYLGKPYQESQLLDTIESLVPEGR